MLEKAPWIARMASRRFARRAITYRKCRMRISGQDQDASKGCGPTRGQFTAIPMRAAERFSPTTERASSGYPACASGSRVAQQEVRGDRSCGDSLRQELGRKAGTLLGQNFLHKAFAAFRRFSL